MVIFSSSKLIYHVRRQPQDLKDAIVQEICISNESHCNNTKTSSSFKVIITNKYSNYYQETNKVTWKIFYFQYAIWNNFAKDFQFTVFYITFYSIYYFSEENCSFTSSKFITTFDIIKFFWSNPIVHY